MKWVDCGSCSAFKIARDLTVGKSRRSRPAMDSIHAGSGGDDDHDIEGKLAAGASDDETEIRRDAFEVLSMLARRLSPEDWSEMQNVLQDGGEEDVTSDEPPDFPGKPLVGGGMVPLRSATAMDSRQRAMDTKRRASNEASFYARFPEAARIGKDPYPVAPQMPLAMDASALATFAEMFPNASRVKII